MPSARKPAGTMNVLHDLGFADAGDLTAKVLLARKINDLLDVRRMTQRQAADRLGLPQPRISAIRNYKLRGISLERMMQALTVLGQHVEIVVTPGSRKAPARIDVAA